MESTIKDIDSLETVLYNESESENVINHNDASEQLSVIHEAKKNRNHSAAELSIINQVNEAFNETRNDSNTDDNSTENSCKESGKDNINLMDTRNKCDQTLFQSQPTEDEQDGSIYSVKW